MEIETIEWYELKERIETIEKIIATHQMDVYKRIEALEERSNADYNYMDQLKHRIEDIDRKLEPKGFTEHKSSGWEGMKRDPKGVEDKRGYTGW